MDQDETAKRKEIVALAFSWLGTPYVSNAAIKGSGGGTDCAMLLYEVYLAAGMIPQIPDPRPYPPQWHMHQNKELYLQAVLGVATEITTTPGPGDVVMFKIGRLFAHGAIVTKFPEIIHARAPGMVMRENYLLDSTSKHALARTEQRFFSFWGK